MAPDPSGDLADALRRHAAGDPVARDEIVAAVFEELRTIARRRLRSSALRADALLQTTGLANDAMLRVLAQEQPIVNREQLLALASRFMNWILIDRARARERTPAVAPFGEDTSEHPGISVDVVQLLAVRDAIRELTEFSPSAAEVLSLRSVTGCTIAESAAILGVGHATIERRIGVAREWLRRRLGTSRG